MFFWSVLALMTGAAVLAVLWPLARARSATAPVAGSDLAVYRDQLDEIARDRDAGLIGVAEAEAARLEVSRRLLAAAETERPDGTTADAARGASWRRRAVAVIGLLGLPALALPLYLQLGSPQLPGQPQSARIASPDNKSIEELVARVEAHLESKPDDGRGWEVVAPIYMRMGRYDDAVRARRNAVRLNGSTAERESDLGEALAAAAQGIVTAEAKAAFERAVALDTKAVKARFYLGLAAEQDGRKKEAAQIWRDMVDQAPPGAGWVGFVRQALVRVDPNAAPPAPPPAAAEAPAAPGPTAADVSAAAQMSPEQRDAMILGMVARLAEKLKTDSTDVDGWLRLVRAYAVLGDRDKALAAAADARKALAGDADKLRQIDELVKGLGLAG